MLENTSIKVANVTFHSKVWHTEGLVAESGSKKEILVLGVRVVLSQVVSKVVALLVLGLSDVGSED